MADELRTVSSSQEKGINLAAALAKKQLQLAQEIVAASAYGSPGDSVLVGAVLNAIATNLTKIET